MTKLQDEVPFIRRETHVARNLQVFCAKFKVHIIRLTLSRLLFQMKRLQHENMNEFIGLCPNPEHFCILTAYCAKGSLEVGIYHKQN